MDWFKRSKPADGVDVKAAKAFKAGEKIHVRRIPLAHTRTEQKLAERLREIEAAGYRLEDQHREGEGLQQSVVATFRLVPLSVGQ
jgi:hypothetical protein